jgi:replicative DNA helicase
VSDLDTRADHAPGGTVLPLRARTVLGDVGAAHDAPRDATSRPWDVPVPLTPTRLLPPFPVGVFPPWLRAMVAEVTTALQVPPDLPATLGLAGLAVAAGGRVDVHPIPGWVEPTNLYTVIALAPGSRKSPTFTVMTRPLYAAEQALCDATESTRLELSLMARRAQAQAEKTARAAEQADNGPDGLMADAIEAARTAADYTDVYEPRLLADDLTPETAATLLARHGGRLGLLSAEGGSFATVTGTRYSASANLEPLLKAHAGDMIRIDRKGRAAERIERPALTIAITTQPGHLATIAGTPEARDRGLLARFLYCLPVNTVGTRAIHPPPVTEATSRAFEAHLSTLVVDLAQTEQRTHLACYPEAVAVLEDLETWLEPRLHPETGELAAVTDWASKMAGTAVRVAGLLHLAAHAGDELHGLDEPITADTMTNAVMVARYYLAHALAVFDALALSPELDAARRVLDWLHRTNSPTFTRRDAFRALASRRFPTATSLDDPLTVLVEHGHIRQLPAPTKAGRPASPVFQTHPDHSRGFLSGPPGVLSGGT